MVRNRLVVCVLPLACAGCPEGTEGPAPTPSANVTSSVTASVNRPATPTSTMGRLDGSATPRVQRAASYALLAGGPQWAQLPEHATDPGAAFDPKLVRRLAPLAHGAMRLRVAKGLEVRGQLARPVIRRIARQSYGRLRLCFEQPFPKHRTLRGRVVVTFVIDHNGKTASVRSTSPIPAYPKSCIEDAFRAMRFPTPADGTVAVTYPIELNPTP